MDMKAQCFGIEVELTGITREAAADIAAAYFETTAVYDGSYYDTYAAIDTQGRKWKFMSDASITPQRKDGRQTISASSEYKTEMVSPIWYNGGIRSNVHYDDSRYHCLNLHFGFQKGTVEFRLFNGTTHAGKIKAYFQLCMAISAQALNQRCASRTKTQTTNEKYTFRTWLLRLGLIGDEFKTAREHLLVESEGCGYYRYASYVPNISALASPALQQFNQKLTEAVDYIVSTGTQNTTEGNWIISFDELQKQTGINLEFNDGICSILVDMLHKRESVADVEMNENAIDVCYYLDFCPQYGGHP